MDSTCFQSLAFVTSMHCYTVQIRPEAAFKAPMNPSSNLKLSRVIYNGNTTPCPLITVLILIPFKRTQFQPLLAM